MTGQGYDRCHSDHYVYFKRLDNKRYIILLLYVDDMLIAGSNTHDINVLNVDVIVTLKCIHLYFLCIVP